MTRSFSLAALVPFVLSGALTVHAQQGTTPPTKASAALADTVSGVAASSGYGSLSSAISDGSAIIAVGPMPANAEAYSDYTLGSAPTPSDPAYIVVPSSMSPMQAAFAAIHEWIHMTPPQTPAPGDTATQAEWQAYMCTEASIHCAVLTAMKNFEIETESLFSCAFQNHVLEALFNATYLCYPGEPIIPSCPNLDISNIPCL